MRKVNCWEYMKCGRELYGAKSIEIGVCPAYTAATGEGLNGGFNSGRACWAIAGTFCGGQVQGSYAQKELSCMSCDFFKAVLKEEGARFQLKAPGEK